MILGQELSPILDGQLVIYKGYNIKSKKYETSVTRIFTTGRYLLGST